MTTLKEYFDTDFNYALSLHQNQKLYSQDGQEEIEIIARVHLDFNSNTKFISYFISQNDQIYNICKSLINNPIWALKIAEGQQVLGGFVGENRMNSSELIFSGRMFIYSESALSESQMVILKQEAKQLGIAIQLRGPAYAAERSAAEKSSPKTYCDSHNRNKTQRPLAISPLNGEEPVRTIGHLLMKTLPENWEQARFYIEENKTEWKATYLQTNELKETPLPLNQDFVINLEKLRDVENVRFPIRSVTFHRDGKYNINYDFPNVNRLGPDEIKGEIEQLQSLDLKTVEIDGLKRQISALTIGHTKKAPMIPVGQKFYRGISWPEKPNNVKDLTYPPTSKVTKLHRAGRASCPLFYCSTAKEAVFYELDCRGGDKLALSEWRLTNKLLTNHVGYHNQAFGQLGANRPTPWWGINNNDSELEEADIIVSEFLAKEFAKIVPINEEHLYKISIAIAEQHFQQDMFDGLMYPTVAMKGNADNFAFKPVCVNKKLILEKVEYIEVREGSRISGYKIKILDFANSFTVDGSIEWKGRLPHWVLRKKGEMLTVKVESGKWVARNPNGEVVEPE